MYNELTPASENTQPLPAQSVKIDKRSKAYRDANNIKYVRHSKLDKDSVAVEIDGQPMDSSMRYCPYCKYLLRQPLEKFCGDCGYGINFHQVAYKFALKQTLDLQKQQTIDLINLNLTNNQQQEITNETNITQELNP